jgi:hypothetical protein
VEYKHAIKDVKREIEEIADANGTSFEYVIRDMYALHYNDY